MHLLPRLKPSPKHISGSIYSLWQQKFLGKGKGIIFMYFQQLKFVYHLLGAFGQLRRLLQTFSVLWQKNVPKTTYLTLSTLPKNEITWEMVHFDVLPTIDLCGSFLVCFCTVMKVSTGIFTLGSKHVPKTQIFPNLPFPTTIYSRWLFIFDVLPTTEVSALFLCIFGQWWKFLQTFSVFGPKMSPKHISGKIYPS